MELILNSFHLLDGLFWINQFNFLKFWTFSLDDNLILLYEKICKMFNFYYETYQKEMFEYEKNRKQYMKLTRLISNLSWWNLVKPFFSQTMPWTIVNSSLSFMYCYNLKFTRLVDKLTKFCLFMLTGWYILEHFSEQWIC